MNTCRHENNAAIPVIVGVVGGAGELASLKPVFDEFRNTFGVSTPINVIQADASGAIWLFAEGDVAPHKSIPLLRSNERDVADDVATYLLRNCHFVLLSATLDKSDSLRCAVERFSEELPDGTPQVADGELSIFELPQPVPVLLQEEVNALKLQIVGRNKIENLDKKNGFSLGLFEYAERVPGWRFRLGLVAEPNSKYASQHGEKHLSFVRTAKDEMGKRWLDCVKALHRQVTFNDEVWSSDKIEPYQASRFGFPSFDGIPHDQAVCDLKKSFEVQCKADLLASKYQRQWQKIRFAELNDIGNKKGYPQRFSSFLWLGGGAASALVYSTEFGGLFGGWSGVVASLIYIVILLLCFVRYVEVRKHSWEQKHQDYRFIAEVLAIQLHWMSGGIKKYASDHFPSGVKNDIQWVRRAVHTCRYLSKVNEAGSLALETVQDAWIKGQIKYHKEQLQKRREAALHVLNKRRSFAGICFVGLFLAFSVFTLYESWSLISSKHGAAHVQQAERVVVQHSESKSVEVNEHSHAAVAEPVATSGVHEHLEAVAAVGEDYGEVHDAEWMKEQLHHVIIILMAISLVLYALLGEAIEGYGIEQELTRSEALVEVYERCLREFKKLSDESKKRKLLMQVGGFAIEAEAHWLVVHRERPMQPVKGG